uniref:Uncharacterized protein n=1 Tax=Tanacetum cinerariifolium TaxID=118510 RepID=A0A6L2NY66_TANCI|nr:hypothetical protein [Tanacetum cinerariifolium]
MFDEYSVPLSVERPIPPAPVVQVLVVSASTPSSTTINQDALSTSHLPSSSAIQPPISHQGVIAGPTIKDNLFAQAEDNPFVNVFALEPSSEESSSGDEKKFKKHASLKLKIVPVSPKEPTQKGKQVKRPAKKATTASITSVVIKDTPGKFVSKKKAPAMGNRGKGI